MCADSATGARSSPEPKGARTALVTAFEPFGGETVNASEEAAKRIHGWRSGDAVVVTRVLSCAYEVCVAEFLEAFERLRPSVVLMTGQAARRRLICVERFARSRVSATAIDNLGALGVAAEGPVRLEAKGADAVARAIRDAGVPVRVSMNAGDYVCNHLYYRVLRHLAGATTTVPAIFIHLPATPAQPPTATGRRPLATLYAARALQAGVQALMR